VPGILLRRALGPYAYAASGFGGALISGTFSYPVIETYGKGVDDRKFQE
jgi:hypothetical protein